MVRLPMSRSLELPHGGRLPLFQVHTMSSLASIACTRFCGHNHMSTFLSGKNEPLPNSIEFDVDVNLQMVNHFSTDLS